ncbi:MAG: MarR family transcriptional regulator [Bacteroidales bacterium]|nr:MarR family transcriptional regulator [Bacteroidales bacterium]
MRTIIHQHDMELNDTVELHIRTSSLALSRMYNSIAAKYGITQTIGYILIFTTKDGVAASKIANLLGMKKSSLTRILQKMEDEGCIIRKEHETDKRITKIFLTEKGVERREIAKATVLEFNDKLVDSISKEDYAVFARVSKKIEQLSDEKLKETQNK